MDVLIVDDDAAIRTSYAKLLEHAGFMVTAVENGLAAFAELQERSYRAIVCDIEMPFLKGNSFYEQLEEMDPPMAGRVIFVTGHADDDAVREFLERTGQPCLFKPVEFDELVDAVGMIAER